MTDRLRTLPMANRPVVSHFSSAVTTFHSDVGFLAANRAGDRGARCWTDARAGLSGLVHHGAGLLLADGLPPEDADRGGPGTPALPLAGLGGPWARGGSCGRARATGGSVAAAATTVE